MVDMLGETSRLNHERYEKELDELELYTTSCPQGKTRSFMVGQGPLVHSL